MKKISLMFFAVLAGAGIAFAAGTTIWSTTGIPVKTQSDSVSHTEFNSLVQTTKGIYHSDNGTPDEYTDDLFGLGVSSPVASLSLAGGLKVGQTSATCNTDIAGAMRYNASSKRLEFCNGTSWETIAVVL